MVWKLRKNMGLLRDLVNRIRSRTRSRFAFQGNIPLPAVAEDMLLRKAVQKEGNVPQELIDAALVSTRNTIWNLVQTANLAGSRELTPADGEAGLETTTAVNAEAFTRQAVQDGGLFDRTIETFKTALSI